MISLEEIKEISKGVMSTNGVYVDNWLNRKLGRVGMTYAQAKEKEKKEQRKSPTNEFLEIIKDYIKDEKLNQKGKGSGKRSMLREFEDQTKKDEDGKPLKLYSLDLAPDLAVSFDKKGNISNAFKIKLGGRTGRRLISAEEVNLDKELKKKGQYGGKTILDDLRIERDDMLAKQRKNNKNKLKS